VNEDVVADPDGTAVNNTSVVLRAITLAGRMLLTGDVELAAQAELMASGIDLAADVLKVPHHGSKYSLPSFLHAVHPRAALVSVGAGNRYGHPSPHTLDELTKEGAMVERTDQTGDIAIAPGHGGPLISVRGEPRAPPRG
jgi:competence protein ComEC